MANTFKLRNCCPTCGSKKLIELAEIDYADPRMMSYLSSSYRIDTRLFASIAKGFSYRIVSCKDCELLFQAYIPSESFLSIIYDEYIDPDKSLSSKSLTEDHSQMYLGDYALIKKLLGKPSSEIKILDYAAGWGNWIKLANKVGFKTFALELSEYRKSHLSNAGIQVVAEADLSKMSIDFVNCDQIFEHLTNPVAVLRAIRECLSDNGMVRISVPHSFHSLKEVSLLDREPKSDIVIPDILAPLEHLNYYNRRSLKTLAKSAGFELVGVSLLNYLSTTNYYGTSKSETLKNILRPFYRRYFSNIVFLKKMISY
jgi:2-polyprenyl-3-methyl-5-hydroxy-6-metoxy-1,4-benzoquinol methylase